MRVALRREPPPLEGVQNAGTAHGSNSHNSLPVQG